MLKNKTEITQILGEFQKKYEVNYRNTEVESYGFTISRAFKSKFLMTVLLIDLITK